MSLPGEITRGGEGGIVRKVREQIDFGKTRAERGLAAPTSKAGYILQAAEMGAPTLIVNRYGKDKDANYALNMAGGALAALTARTWRRTVKDVREKEHQEPKDRKT